MAVVDGVALPLSVVKARRSNFAARGPTQKPWRRIYLREWRLFRGHSIEGLAELAGVSPAQISLIENRKSAGSPESLEKLANVLRCEVGELLDIKPVDGGAIVRAWVPDEDRARIEAVIAAMKK